MADEDIQLTQDEQKLLTEFEAYIRSIAEGFSKKLEQIENQRLKEAKDQYQELLSVYEKQTAEFKKSFERQTSEHSIKHEAFINEYQEKIKQSQTIMEQKFEEISKKYESIAQSNEKNLLKNQRSLLIKAGVVFAGLLALQMFLLKFLFH